jgi:hypothetical protein
MPLAVATIVPAGHDLCLTRAEFSVLGQAALVNNVRSLRHQRLDNAPFCRDTGAEEAGSVMRRHTFPAAVREPLFLFRDDKALKAHPAYRATKAGDAAAAVNLVESLAGPLTAQAAAAWATRHLCCPPCAGGDGR